ncbi:MAG TPA: TrmH family RNA methyltransferase [Acidimicrobiales bacterium]
MRNELTRRFHAAYHDPSFVVLEGFHPARHAIRFGSALQTAVTYDRDKLMNLAARLAPDVVAAIDDVVQVVDPVRFANLCPRSLSSPLLSITARPPVDMTRLFAANGRPVVHLEGPRNPGNVGSVIRVAAAADVAAVTVSGQVDPWLPVAIRSAAGLQFAVDAVSAELPSATDRTIVALDADGEPFRPSTLDPNAILVVGGERYGLSAAVRERADRTIAVPMRPGVSSINLATAVSAVLFSWRIAVEERTGAAPW